MHNEKLDVVTLFDAISSCLDPEVTSAEINTDRINIFTLHFYQSDTQSANK